MTGNLSITIVSSKRTELRQKPCPRETLSRRRNDVGTAETLRNEVQIWKSQNSRGLGISLHFQSVHPNSEPRVLIGFSASIKTNGHNGGNVIQTTFQKNQIKNQSGALAKWSLNDGLTYVCIYIYYIYIHIHIHIYHYLIENSLHKYIW